MTATTDVSAAPQRSSRAAAGPPPGPAARIRGRAQEQRRAGPVAVFTGVPMLALHRRRTGGLGLGPADWQTSSSGSPSTCSPGSASHGLPPLLHPRVVQGEPCLQDRARHRGHAGDRGPGARLGLRPPQAPQVQRQGGRPALAVAVRRRLEGADQGPGLGAHGLAVRPRRDLAGEVLPRLAGRPTTSSGRAQVVPGAGRRHAARARR